MAVFDLNKKCCLFCNNCGMNRILERFLGRKTILKQILHSCSIEIIIQYHYYN